MNKSIFKMSKDELQLYLQTMRKHLIIKNKKGKGSYSRKQKHKGNLNAKEN